MTKNFRFYIVIFLISYFAVIKPAQAILPLIYAGIVASIDATAALTTGQAIGSALIGIGAAALIGQRIGILNINGTDSENNPVSLQIPLTGLTRDRPISNPNLPSNTGSITNSVYKLVCEPSTSSLGSCGTNGTRTTTYTYSSLTDNTCTGTASTTACSQEFYGDAQTSLLPASAKITVCNTPLATGIYPNCTLAAGVEPVTCPTGYALQSSTCVLTTPEAIPDNKIGFQNNGATISPIPTDADNDAYSANSPAAQLWTDLHYWKVDIRPTQFDGTPYPPESGLYNGAPVKVSISRNTGAAASGACPYDICIPVPGLPGHFRISGMSNTGSGTAQATVIDVNSTTGIVTNVQTVPLNGTLLTSGSSYINVAGATVVVPVNSTVLATPVAGTYVQSQSNTLPQTVVNFPADLAKTGEAAIAAKTITDKLDQEGGTANLIEPALSNPLVDYFNPLRSWIPPSYAGTCPAGSFTWLSNTYTFNAMCALFDSNMTIIQGAMNVTTIIAALFIVLGA